MNKRIISIVLVVFMALSLFAFVGCSNREETQEHISDLQQQITELQSLLQQQTALLAELQNANSEMTDQITELTNAQTATISKITELQEQLQSQAEKLTTLEDALNSNLIFNASKALQEVREYAESKGESNYLADNWVFVENLLEMAETQIHKQKTIEDIYKLIPKIKASIDIVPKDVVLEEKTPWDGIIDSNINYITMHIQPAYITSEYSSRFMCREFTIDDFWMVDDMVWCNMYSPRVNLVVVEIRLKVWNKETVTKAVRTLEKLCFHKAAGADSYIYGESD